MTTLFCIGIKHNDDKHTVSGAAIRTLTCITDIYLTYNDLQQFDTVVMYIWGSDLSGNVNTELIEEQYEQIIALIKAGNFHLEKKYLRDLNRDLLNPHLDIE